MAHPLSFKGTLPASPPFVTPVLLLNSFQSSTVSAALKYCSGRKVDRVIIFMGGE